MKVFSAIRSHEWWGFKLPPLLAIAYATALRSDHDLYSLGPLLLFLLGSLIVGAVFVSLINDLTDMEEDRNSGKHNRMALLPLWQRYGLLFCSLAAGAYFFYFFAGDVASAICYAASWLAFTLYSVPPFRLKKQGLWGALADACGAHLFPGLLLLTAMSHAMNVPLSWAWVAAVAVWSFGYGLRGILWHQFSDREHDRTVGLRTFATSIEPSKFKKTSWFLFAVELAGLFAFLWFIARPLPFVFLGLYVLILVAYRRKPNMEFLVVLPASHPAYHILMSSYYQMLLPISLLLTDALAHPRGWIILILHLMLFPRNIRRLAMDLIKL
jgi:4-hydroxybenzoate polyprenyltransferase